MDYPFFLMVASLIFRQPELVVYVCICHHLLIMFWLNPHPSWQRSLLSMKEIPTTPISRPRNQKNSPLNTKILVKPAFFLVKPTFLCICPIVSPWFSEIFGAFSVLGLRAPACARASWAPASKEPRSTQRQKQLKGPNLRKWGENPWHICWCSTHGDPWYDDVWW